MNRLYTIEDLQVLMARLRDPQTGCPWDLKQSYRTIVPSTLEEVYEVVDAIEREDYENLQEELGDLMFQVIFYCQLANEEERFSFAEVVSGIVEKLLRRHPHVFPNGCLEEAALSNDANGMDAQAVTEQWERIKQQEKQQRGPQTLLADIPVALPALARAKKIQKKMAVVGFDWETPQAVFAKLREEVDECEAAMQSADQVHIEDEIGDILFAVVNLARHYKADPETLLRRANQKVMSRFDFIEKSLVEQGVSLEQASLDEMEALWQSAKQLDT